MLHRSSSCMHAVAITPVESQSASFALFLCNISLPRNHGGSASTSRLSRPAQRSLALWPAYSPSHFHDPLHRRLQPFRYLYNCSDCYRLERKLPGRICTRWKTVPLHGAHDKGRYRQLRRDRNLPDSSSRNRLQHIRYLVSSAQLSRVGTEFDPPKKVVLGIVDVNVLYRSTSGLAISQEISGSLPEMT